MDFPYPPALETPRLSLSPFSKPHSPKLAAQALHPAQEQGIKMSNALHVPLVPTNNEVFMAQSLWQGSHLEMVYIPG